VTTTAQLYGTQKMPESQARLNAVQTVASGRFQGCGGPADAWTQRFWAQRFWTQRFRHRDTGGSRAVESRSNLPDANDSNVIGIECNRQRVQLSRTQFNHA
jgi:hypothetical protein